MTAAPEPQPRTFRCSRCGRELRETRIAGGRVRVLRCAVCPPPPPKRGGRK